MLVFPPFFIEVRNTKINMGYGFILDPPIYYEKRAPGPYKSMLDELLSYDTKRTSSVNTGMLLVQWIGTLLLGGVFLFLFKDGEKLSKKKVKREESYFNLKLCPSCHAFQDAEKKDCPNCGHDLTNVEISKKVDNSNIDESKKFLGGEYHPWRRFFARMVDVSTLGLALLFILAFIVGILFPEHAIGFSKAMENKIISGFLLFLLWLPLEAILLSSTGTTLGKWIFGIRVLSLDGNKLLFSGALKRTSLVWIQGIGFGIPFVAIFTQLFGYRRLTRTGTTLWDSSVNSAVTHKEWGPVRAIICILCVLSVWFFLSLLNTIGTTYPG